MATKLIQRLNVDFLVSNFVSLCDCPLSTSWLNPLFGQKLPVPFGHVLLLKFQVEAFADKKNANYKYDYKSYFAKHGCGSLFKM